MIDSRKGKSIERLARDTGGALTMDATARFEKTLKECFKRKDRMLSALAKIEHALPLDGVKYAGLTEDDIEHIDRYLFRFAKLQDAMGQRLFRLIMKILGGRY